MTPDPDNRESNAFKLLRTQYEYIVVDLPNDFYGTTIQVLDAADVIIGLLTPEMASVRAEAAALDTYRKLDYKDENIKLVMNWIFEHKGLRPKNIEIALRHPIDLSLPFASDIFIDAINKGRPILRSKPKHQVSEMLEWFAFQISKPEDRVDIPASLVHIRR